MSDHAAPSVPRSTGGTLGQRGRNGCFVPAAGDPEGDLVAGLVAPDAGDHLAVVLDRLPVDRGPQVAGPEAGLGRQVDRDGEPDADVAVGAVAGRADGAVDADDPPVAVGEHPAGVAWVDGGVGLDDLAAVVQDPVGRADDPGGHGLVEAEGAADGDRQLADLDVLADGERGRGETGAVHLDHADVVQVVGADDLALELGAVVEADLDLVDPVDDVGGGHDVAVLVVDEARADAAVVADLDHGGQQGLGDGGGRLLARGDGGGGDRGLAGGRDAGAGRLAVVAVERLADAEAGAEQDHAGQHTGQPAGRPPTGRAGVRRARAPGRGGRVAAASLAPAGLGGVGLGVRARGVAPGRLGPGGTLRGLGRGPAGN